MLWIFWIVIALFTADQATKRNRNEVAWGLLGFLFGIFALGALFLLPPKLPASHSRPSLTDQTTEADYDV